ncbi:hypothetical protein BASA62_006274 [Batrachochytrium salamandrivorans]|nr:hypothetical protein BASA62_006274 [Batrachochytrium salamandrivorans]
MDNMLENKRSFMLLNGLFTKFSIHNPESHCILEKNSDDTFERAFLSPRALQLAFRNCRPMIILDACHLRSKYGGVVMSAVAHDGEGSIVPLAVAIASIENKDNWVFFLSNLLFCHSRVIQAWHRSNARSRERPSKCSKISTT